MEKLFDEHPALARLRLVESLPYGSKLELTLATEHCCNAELLELPRRNDCARVDVTPRYSRRAIRVVGGGPPRGGVPATPPPTLIW